MATQTFIQYVTAVTAAFDLTTEEAGAQYAAELSAAEAEASRLAAGEASTSATAAGETAETLRVESGYLVQEVAGQRAAALDMRTTVTGRLAVVYDSKDPIIDAMRSVWANNAPRPPMPCVVLNDPARTASPGIATTLGPVTTFLSALIRPRNPGVPMSLWDGGTRSGAPRIGVYSVTPAAPFGPSVPPGMLAFPLPHNTWSWVVIEIRDTQSESDYNPASRYRLTCRVMRGASSLYRGPVTQEQYDDYASTRPVVFGDLAALTPITGDLFSATTAPFVGDVAAVLKERIDTPTYGVGPISRFTRSRTWLYHPILGPAWPGSEPQTH